MKNIRFILVLILSLSALSAGVWAADSSPSHMEPTTVPESATSPVDPAGPAAATNEAEAPEHAAEEHGKGGLPQLNFGTYPSQMFWMAVFFVLLFTVFSTTTLPTIGKVIGSREGKIKGDLDAAQALQQQAEDIRLAYEKGLDQARADAVKAIQDVENAAKDLANSQQETFRKKAEADIKAAESRMDDLRAISMDEMTSIAAEVASVAAEKITGQSSDVSHAKAIVQSIANKAKAA